MARPLRIEYPDAFYHVTGRGNERHDIFRNVGDRRKFLSCLQSSNERYLAVIHAYCLMTNHYHLLLQTPLGNLSQVMHHINQAYANYFNVKRKRVGHLFQGRFQAVLVEADSYATELSRYIHLNPVRADMVALPEDYPWSSFHGYLDPADCPAWLTTSFILGYFCDRAAYRKFVHEMMEKKVASPLGNADHFGILGREKFVQEILEEHVWERKMDRDLPTVRGGDRNLSPELIHSVAAEVFSSEPGTARKAAIFISHCYSGLSLKEIGAYFELSLSGVTQSSKRFRMRVEREMILREKVELVERRLALAL
ncbi:REP-associated tyrosine transposase [Geomesophilobacter sediminis]|uniref:Transposase n=1 Tax=Geomesophilobacter sediminis TaxID=2798584 RepID=A0A8J7IPP0_9BACT|nr:transposase [Geomesophilobacter sediminis]MBJ6725598.1 transposase [Geomesophilobacter sediminis]